jgi:hypothetical protein
LVRAAWPSTPEGWPKPADAYAFPLLASSESPPLVID